MRKIISCILCLAVMLLSMPGYALADNQAKEEFIDNYMHILDKTLQIQNSCLENIQNNTFKIDVEEELSDGSITLWDGTDMSDISGSGSLEIVGSMQEEEYKISFNGSLLEYDVDGVLYLAQDSIIIPKDTIVSINNNIDNEYGRMSDEELDSMPEYMVFNLGMTDEEWAIIKESFSYSMYIYEKSDEIKAFYEELLNIIPDGCFYLEDGYAVMDMKPSMLDYVLLLNNLKENKLVLAEKYTDIMVKPAYFSDEEFDNIKSDIKSGIITAIDDIQITDLGDMEMPFEIEEFKMCSTYNSLLTTIKINVDIEGETLQLALTGDSRFYSSRYNSDITMDVLVDSPEIFMDVSLQATSTGNSDGEEFELEADGDIRFDEDSVSGEIVLNFSADYDSSSRVNVPSVDENNSMFIDLSNTVDYGEEDWTPIPGEQYYFLEGEVNDGTIKVFVDGWKMQFEDAQPVIIQDRTMLPLRAIGEYLGCEVTWQPPDTVIISDGYTEDLVLKINSTTYQVGDEYYTMDTAPVIIDGRTYVPIRLVAEYFGFSVDWDDTTKSVILMSY